MKARIRALFTVLGVFLLATPAAISAQMATNVPEPVRGAQPVTIERIKVHSPAIAGNLEGESPDRDVLVVLPPGYARQPYRRYPVVYALHGYSISPEQWIKEIHVPQTVEGAFAKGSCEMIVVLPDAKTIHNGSMYSSSITTGDFETFVARDLVSYIDARYRTIADRRSRGLVGHSMGGYGATRIGMKHADVFGALYIMSPCCLSPRDPKQMDPALMAKLGAVQSLDEAAKLAWGERALLATAAAWSPDPRNPPLYLDRPLKDGAVRSDVLARWTANAPLAFLDQYVGNLRRYRAIAIDVGDQDGLKADTQKLHEAIDEYGIANAFEIYHGTHTSDVAYRFQDHVIPFFSQNLLFASTPSPVGRRRGIHEHP